MFGEEAILGKSYHNIDEKNRIILPSITQAEEKDEIAYVIENEYSFNIYNLKMIKEKILKLNNKLDNCKLEEIEVHQKLINDIYMRIIGIGNVDKQRRTTIPKVVIEKYNIKENIILQGGYDHLKLFKDEENYDKYVKSLKKEK